MKNTKRKDLVPVSETQKIIAKLEDVSITEEDFEGYDHSGRLFIPYFSIRQKDLKDEAGKKTVQGAGGFKIVDPVEDGEKDDVEKLIGTIIAWKRGRVYFESLESKQPTCKSLDGLRGSKFGDCSTCEYNQWHSEKSRPEGSPACAEVRNICFVDEKLGPGILTLGRSGLKPFDIYDELLKRQKPRAPHHFLLVQINTEYQTEPAPHFTPKFKLLDILPKDQRSKIKEERKLVMELFKTGVEKMDHKPEDYLGDDEKRGLEEMEKEGEDDELPF